MAALPKDLSLVCLNAYLIPPNWVDEYTATCIRQDERAVAIAEFCADKDVVCLQEVWGSHIAVLQTKLEASHDLLHRNKSCSNSWWLSWLNILTGPPAESSSSSTSANSSTSSFWGWTYAKKESFATILDCLFFWYQANGGLWCSAHKSLSIDQPSSSSWSYSEACPIVASVMHSYSNGTLKMRLGVLATLIDVSAKNWGCVDPNNNNNNNNKTYVLILNTHLHFLDIFVRTEARAIQLREMVEFLRDIVLRNRLGLKFFSELDWKRQCAVVVCGDFNISYMSEQYEDILNLYFPKARDLYCELHPEVGIEGQYTYDPDNSLVNFPEQPSRIDYVFLIDRLPPKASAEYAGGQPDQQQHKESEENENEQHHQQQAVEFLRLKCSSFEIVKQPNGKEYSDHWPLLALLRPL